MLVGVGFIVILLCVEVLLADGLVSALLLFVLFEILLL